MRQLRALIIYLVVLFVGGALPTPWVYRLAEAANPKLAQQPFHRFVHRSWLVLALAGLYPLLRSPGAQTLAHVGLVKRAGHWRRFITGPELGYFSTALVAGLALLDGARTRPEQLAIAKVSVANVWLWGSGMLIDGWLALGVPTLTFITMPRLPILREQASAP